MASSGNSTSCLNCGRATGPNFCSHCGQEVELRQGPLIQVVREVLSDWLSLDSRLLRSLRELARPGRLSELYLAGKRAPFLRALRLYLIAGVVVFATGLKLDTPDASTINLYVAGESIGPELTGPVKRSISLFKADSFAGRQLIRLAGSKVDRLKSLDRQEILDALFAGFRRQLPLALILFVPGLALGLKLLYVRGRAKHFLYLDHLVFSLHFQSALFFGLAGAWLVTRLLGGWLAAAVFMYGLTAIALLFVYLPLAIRRFYGQSRVWTAVKTIGVLLIYQQIVGLGINVVALRAIWDVWNPPLV